MNLMIDVFESILKEIVPTPEELVKINEIVDVLGVLLKNKAKELNIEYTVIEPQGSTGIKQTQLRNDFDIDLFIGLPHDKYKHKYEGLSRNQWKKVSKKDFLKLCNKWIIPSLILKEFRNPRLLYAEHPYVTIDFVDKEQDLEIKIDIVLYFALDKDYLLEKGPITAVDRSPWHGRFVRDKLSQDQKNDVRLLKQFFKACHSYGDKSALGKVGFIGYCAELLIYHFENIEKCFKNFDKLEKMSLDYHGRNKTELEKKAHFRNDHLIITDPIDKNRNVASAISEKAYKYVNHRVQGFLKNPKKEYFEIKRIPETDNTNLEKIFIIECKSASEETHYTICRDKLHSLGDSIKSIGEKEPSHADRFGKIFFEVYFEDKIDEYNLAVYCEKTALSEAYDRRGPPANEKQHTDKFKKKNPNYFEKDGYLWIQSKRKFKDFLSFLEDFVRARLSDKLELLNVSKGIEAKTSSAKRTIHVLKDMVLPFYL